MTIAFCGPLWISDRNEFNKFSNDGFFWITSLFLQKAELLDGTGDCMISKEIVQSHGCSRHDSISRDLRGKIGSMHIFHETQSGFNHIIKSKEIKRSCCFGGRTRLVPKWSAASVSAEICRATTFWFSNITYICKTFEILFITSRETHSGYCSVMLHIQFPHFQWVPIILLKSYLSPSSRECIMSLRIGEVHNKRWSGFGKVTDWDALEESRSERGTDSHGASDESYLSWFVLTMANTSPSCRSQDPFCLFSLLWVSSNPLQMT
jgi:hypothetical protein